MNLTKTEDILSGDVQFAMSVLRRTGDLSPMFVIHGASGEVVPISALTETDEEKDQTYKLIELLNVACNARAYTHMATAWMSRPKNQGESAVRPSLDPDRQEIMIVSVITRTAILAHITKIFRDDAGNITDLEHMEIDGKTAISGRAAELLPLVDITPEMTMEAKVILNKLGINLPDPPPSSSASVH